MRQIWGSAGQGTEAQGPDQVARPGPAPYELDELERVT